ncbi:MAG: hypothetical protein KAI81_08485, partial [Candidatus Marinimicrobia bacterium]|nr:hypothetical protein [Candidatus Neomarinimicrobiota bacterium]
MKRLLFVFLGTVVLLHSQIQPKIVVSSDKSPKKAMAMSAIIPGAGQLYANKYVASAVYVGLEIALIASSVISGNKGRS